MPATPPRTDWTGRVVVREYGCCATGGLTAVKTRSDLLAEANRRDREAAEIAERIEAGEPCLDSTLAYRRLQAQHLRRLAADALEHSERD